MNNQQFLQHLRGKLIIGVDEVGRGSWAGPLVVGAVMLDIGAPIAGLGDSKLIPKQRREQLASQITALSSAAVTGWVWPAEIDELGLTASTTLAIERAIEKINNYDHIVIDGSINYLPDNARALTCVKADSLVPAVSAASILAKVARDNYMADQAKQYPQYGFELHVGYGTARHKRALVSYGVTDLHRRSFGPVRQLLSL
ncbi:MAG: ribonuclease HII [Candidatus Saccharimonadales bacterium]